MENITNGNFAFLYKLKERDVLTAKFHEKFTKDAQAYLQGFSRRIEELLSKSSISEIEIGVHNFFVVENSNAEEVHAIYEIAELSKMEIFIGGLLEKFKAQGNQVLGIFQEELRKKVKIVLDHMVLDAKVSKEIRMFSFQMGVEEYFAPYFQRNHLIPEPFQTLRDSGKLYCPINGKHTWEQNLAWLLDRFLIKTEFVVFSEVSPENKYRSRGKVGRLLQRNLHMLQS